MTLCCAVFMTGCTTPTINKFQIAAAAVDTLVTALEIADTNPLVDSIANAGEHCINTVLPLLEAGGNVATIANQAVAACLSVAYPVVPAGTDTKIANDIGAIAKDVLGFLQSFGITLPPAGSMRPALARSVTVKDPTAVYKPTPADLKALTAVRTKMAKWHKK